MTEGEFAMLERARGEVAKMPAVLERMGSASLRIYCYGCKRDHRITRSVHGTRCHRGSSSFTYLRALDMAPVPGAATC